MGSQSSITTVISGSFRKHLGLIYSLKKELEKEGIEVVSPHGNASVNPEDEFVILDADPVESPELLQSSIFAKIRTCTFLVIANFDGYMGNAGILEIGYALAVGIKVYSLEPVTDPNLAPYITLLNEVLPGINLTQTV